MVLDSEHHKPDSEGHKPDSELSSEGNKTESVSPTSTSTDDEIRAISEKDKNEINRAGESLGKNNPDGNGSDGNSSDGNVSSLTNDEGSFLIDTNSNDAISSSTGDSRDIANVSKCEDANNAGEDLVKTVDSVTDNNADGVTDNNVYGVTDKTDDSMTDKSADSVTDKTADSMKDIVGLDESFEIDSSYDSNDVTVIERKEVIPESPKVARTSPENKTSTLKVGTCSPELSPEIATSEPENMTTLPETVKSEGDENAKLSPEDATLIEVSQENETPLPETATLLPEIATPSPGISTLSPKSTSSPGITASTPNAKNEMAQLNESVGECDSSQIRATDFDSVVTDNLTDVTEMASANLPSNILNADSSAGYNSDEEEDDEDYRILDEIYMSDADDVVSNSQTLVDIVARKNDLMNSMKLKESTFSGNLELSSAPKRDLPAARVLAELKKRQNTETAVPTVAAASVMMKGSEIASGGLDTISRTLNECSSRIEAYCKEDSEENDFLAEFAAEFAIPENENFDFDEEMASKVLSEYEELADLDSLLTPSKERGIAGDETASTIASLPDNVATVYPLKKDESTLLATGDSDLVAETDSTSEVAELSSENAGTSQTKEMLEICVAGRVERKKFTTEEVKRKIAETKGEDDLDDGLSVGSASDPLDLDEEAFLDSDVEETVENAEVNEEADVTILDVIIKQQPGVGGANLSKQQTVAPPPTTKKTDSLVIAKPKDRPLAVVQPVQVKSEKKEEAGGEVFVSNDPEENADNNDPKWDYMRNLPDDYARYKAVRNRWRNLDIPNPKKDLTIRFRRQPKNTPTDNTDGLDDDCGIPAKRLKRSPNDERMAGSWNSHEKPVMYPCTLLFEHAINTIMEQVERQRMKLVKERNDILSHLADVQTMEREMLMQRCYNMNQYQMEYMVMNARHLRETENIIRESREKFAAVNTSAKFKMDALKNACAEIKQFHEFYPNEHGSNELAHNELMHLTQNEINEITEIDTVIVRMYEQFYNGL